MKGSRLPVLNTVAAALAYCAQHIVTFLSIFFLPWFAGAIAAIVLDAFWQGQLHLGQAPIWLHDLLWAPFSATAVAGMLRFALEAKLPQSYSPLVWSCETRPITAVLVLWFMSWYAIDRGLDAARNLVGEYIGSYGPPVGSLEWSETFERFAFAAQTATYGTWILKCAVVFALYGLVAIIVAEGRMDWRRNWRLLKSSPIALFGIVIVTAIALRTVELGYSWALGYLSLTPSGWDHMNTWRQNVIPAFLLRATWFPIDFLYHALGACVLARTYQRLTLGGDVESRVA